MGVHFFARIKLLGLFSRYLIISIWTPFALSLVRVQTRPPNYFYCISHGGQLCLLSPLFKKFFWSTPERFYFARFWWSLWQSRILLVFCLQYPLPTWVKRPRACLLWVECYRVQAPSDNFPCSHSTFYDVSPWLQVWFAYSSIS